MANVKWLARVTVLDRPFGGYQQTQAYRMRHSEEENGEPVTRMLPRALMAPPGVPDFMTRERFLEPGPCTLEGRAWSGLGAIESVEVSTDGGASWEPAAVRPPLGPHAWRGWSFEWEPPGPGTYELCCRARDDAANVQPLEDAWNLGGYANTAVQRVPVTVR